MTKEELVSITLKQLLDSFYHCPECFEMYDSEMDQAKGFRHCTIVWKPKHDVSGTIVPDPNHSTKTIIVSHDRLTRTLSCHIYFKDVNVSNLSMQADAQVTLDLNFFSYFRFTWRTFKKLRKYILVHRKTKDSNEYIKKLSSVFPAAIDDKLF